MSEIEQTTTPPPPAAKPKKPVRHKRRNAPRRAAPAPKPETPAEFAGLTAANCCNACTPARCVISGTVICAHPRKGGLQASQMSDHEAINRFGRAKDALS